MADYRAEARQAAQRHGLDPGVFLRQIKQESGFNPTARSPAGALGIAQIMPATARGWNVNPLNPRAALNAAAAHMAGYVKKYGSYRNALVAYNAGPGAVGGSLPAETQNYIKVILGGHEPSGTPRTSGGATASAASAASVGGSTRTVTTTTPGVDNRVARASLIQSFLSDRNADPVDFAVQANALKDIAPTSTSRTVRTPGTTQAASSAASSNVAAGAAFAKAHSPLLELIHNTGSGGGYAVKDGRKVNGPQFYSSVWAGHADHVHVAAGPKTVVALGKLAQRMGLHVGENPHFGGVDPVHVPGSYHYKGEAIDVSGDAKRMNQYAARVERLYGIH